MGILGVKPTRFYSDKQEKSIVKSVGGKQTSNSGATSFQKGDILTDSFLIEAKTSTSERNTFSIQKKWLDKMQEEAFAMGKSYSALAFDFGDGVNHYVISEKLFKILKEHLEREDDLK